MRKQDVMLVSIGIFLTVVAWLIADVYHASTQNQVKIKIEIPNVQKYDISADVLKTLETKRE